MKKQVIVLLAGQAFACSKSDDSMLCNNSLNPTAIAAGLVSPSTNKTSSELR